MGKVLGNDLNLGFVGGTGKLLPLPAISRHMHLHVSGSSGAGKSRLLEHLIQQDIWANRKSKCGMLLLDPHGSLYSRVLNWLIRKDINRPVVLIDLRQDEWVLAYNLLRRREHADPGVIVENLVQAIAHVWGQENTNDTPRYSRWATNVLRTLYDGNFTLREAVQLLGTDSRVRVAMARKVESESIRDDWAFANTLRGKDLDEHIGSTLNRFRRFLDRKIPSRVFGQSDVSLDLTAAIEEGAIILVNLSTGKAQLSHTDAALFGTLLMSDLWIAGQERDKAKEPKPFYVYIDEFQQFVTPTIADNLDQARGFGLHLTLSSQFPNQLVDLPNGKRVYRSIMENAQNKIAFRLNDPENLEAIARLLFLGVMNPDEIKHRLYSTKVMRYKEEIRVSRSVSDMKASAYAEHESTSEDAGAGASESFGGDGESGGSSQSTNNSASSTAGRTYSNQQAHTEGETHRPTLIPVMGQEESSVQFRSLEEQLHRAMVALFDQGQREFTTRLVGMKAPVSVRTPVMPDIRVRPDRVREYIEKTQQRWPFVRKTADALADLQARDKLLKDMITGFAEVVPEPSTARRLKK